MRTIQSLKKLIEDQVSVSPNEVSIIDLVDLIVEHGFISRSSDIHIEPEENRVVVRMRIDGMLHDAIVLPQELHSEVISRIKVLSGLKTDMHHVPQDGRFKAKIEGSAPVDIRISIAPTYYGENAVLRILAEAAQVFNLEDLGYTKEQLDIIGEAIGRPYGMILANGPTRSGKTTSLYAMIKRLNTRDVSIITIEDPIEYSISGITQMPVNIQAGLTFASGLRSILRQDPNIIMVGEIRDSETADIAVNAALTGHLVFSTLHTNDAATTFPRLMDMGALPFLIASTVNVVISQRLVRMVCKTCRKERSLSAAELKSLSSVVTKSVLPENVFAVGPGCNDCDGKGYKSRIGVHEVLAITEGLRSLIVGHADATQIKNQAIKEGMKTIVEDGILKAAAGITTIEEILRIIHE